MEIEVTSLVESSTVHSCNHHLIIFNDYLCDRWVMIEIKDDELVQAQTKLHINPLSVVFPFHLLALSIQSNDTVN